MDKEQNVKKTFLEYMVQCNIQKDELSSLIKSFSYFIGCSNENYKYNLTYLESFCDKFMAAKSAINNKNEYFNIFSEYALDYISDNTEKFIITMDDFWTFEYNKNFSKTMECNFNIKKTHTGIINEKLLESERIRLDFKCIGNNINYFDYCYIELKINNLDKDTKDIDNKIKKFVENVFEVCSKTQEEKSL